MAELRFDVKINLDYEQFAQALKGIETNVDKLRSLFAQAIQGVPAEALSQYDELGRKIKGVSNKLKENVDVAHSARVVLLNLNYVIRDLPWGLVGITNNIDMLVQRFTDLVQIGGGARGAFRLLMEQIIGPAGLMLGISALTSALTYFAIHARRAKTETDGLIERFGEVGKIINEAQKPIEDLDKTLERISKEPRRVFEIDILPYTKAVVKVDETISEIEKKIAKITEDLKSKEATRSFEDMASLSLKASKEIENYRKQIEALEAEKKNLAKGIEIITGEQRKWLNLAEKFANTLDLNALGIQKTIINLEALKEALQVKMRAGVDATTQDILKYQNALDQLNEILKGTKKTTEDVFSELTNRFKILSEAVERGVISWEEAEKEFTRIVETIDKLLKQAIPKELSYQLQLLKIDIQDFKLEFNQKQIEKKIQKIAEEVGLIELRFQLGKIESEKGKVELERLRSELEKILGEINIKAVKLEKAEELRDDVLKLKDDIEKVLSEIKIEGVDIQGIEKVVEKVRGVKERIEQVLGEIETKRMGVEVEGVDKVINGIRKAKDEIEKIWGEISVGKVEVQDIDKVVEKVREVKDEIEKLTGEVDVGKIKIEVENTDKLIDEIARVRNRILNITSDISLGVRKETKETLDVLERWFNNINDLVKVGGQEVFESYRGQLLEIIQALDELFKKAITEGEKLTILQVKAKIEKFIIDMPKELFESEIRKQLRDIELQEQIIELKVRLGEINVNEALRQLNELYNQIETIKAEIEKKPIEISAETSLAVLREQEQILSQMQSVSRRNIFDTAEMMERAFSRTFDFIASQWFMTWQKNKDVFSVFVMAMTEEMMRQLAKVLAGLMFKREQGTGEGISGINWGQVAVNVALIALGALLKRDKIPEAGQIERINLREAEIRVPTMQAVVQAVPRINFAIQAQMKTVEGALYRVEKAIREQRAEINILLDKRSLVREIAPELTKYSRLKEL